LLLPEEDDDLAAGAGAELRAGADDDLAAGAELRAGADEALAVGALGLDGAALSLLGLD